MNLLDSLNCLDEVFKFVGMLVFVSALLAISGSRSSLIGLTPWGIIGFVLGAFVVTVIKNYYGL